MTFCEWGLSTELGTEGFESDDGSQVCVVGSGERKPVKTPEVTLLVIPPDPGLLGNSTASTREEGSTISLAVWVLFQKLTKGLGTRCGRFLLLLEQLIH